METPKILPNNLEAEQALLASIFMSVEAQGLCFVKLKPDDFYSNAHQKIFKAMLNNYAKNYNIDYVTVTTDLQTTGDLDNVGGMEYIVNLTNYLPSAANFKQYLEIVRNTSILRKVISACQNSINFCFENNDAKNVIAYAEKSIFDISKEQDVSELTHISKGLMEVVDRMEKLSIDKNAFRGLKTGFPTLDNITKGFHKGALILLAARPGIGKTSLALNICSNAALLSNSTVAVFSLEMPMSQIAQRVMCSVGLISMTEATAGTNNPSTWEAVLQTKDKISNAGIYVDDSSLTTPAQIISKCRRLKAEKGLDLIMIDYLQLMKSDSSKKDSSRQQEVADLTRSLKIAARELECPIILLSQLSRDIEKRVDHKPQLSDLRESGAIEQDADIVMFIDRTNEVDKDVDDNEEANVNGEDCRLVIAKHRNGALGSVNLKWMAENTCFVEPKSNRFSYAKVKKVDDTSTDDNLDNLTPVEDDFNGDF